MNWRMFIEGFNRAIEPIKGKVMLMINRGVVKGSNDSGSFQTLQLNVMAGETKSAVPSVQHFGFSSRPPVNSEVIMLCINGNRENSVVIGTESRQHRYVNLDEGDAIIYNKNGKFVHVKGGNVEMLLDKLIINNSEHEMVAVVSEYMERVNEGFILTAFGPQTWITSTKELLDETKEKFDTFKV